MSRFALITGATSGIGRALAEDLAADGHDLIAVGRREDRLAQLKAKYPEVEIETVVADLSTDDGIVATEFHGVQGLDMSAVPRMSAEDVVEAAWRGLELGEVVSAPGVEDTTLLEAVCSADLAAFGGQSPELASRYRTTPS
jgi:short-subunit dehydrogenase